MFDPLFSTIILRDMGEDDSVVVLCKYEWKPSIAPIGIRDRDLLEVAAIAEVRSEHPLGQAILAAASERGVKIQPPDRFQYMPVSASPAGRTARRSSWATAR